jgi:hypothetical protein
MNITLACRARPDAGAHQRGLARAVRPEQAQALAGAQRQADATQRFLCAEAPRQAVNC